MTVYQHIHKHIFITKTRCITTYLCTVTLFTNTFKYFFNYLYTCVLFKYA